MFIELYQTNGDNNLRKITLELDQIESYEEYPIYPLQDDENDITKFKMQTKIVMKTGNVIHCDLISYGTLNNAMQ